MPYLPSDRARRDAAPPPLDSDEPPLVLTRRSGSSLFIEHGCPRAGALGLRGGMTLGQAQAIAPGLRAAAHEPHRDRALLLQLAGWALRFSPIVEPVEPDTLVLDVSGCARLFAGEPNIARQAVEGLRRQGLHVRAAIADTVGAAHALAGAGSERIVVVPPGQTCVYIASLPPAALRIDARVVERLEALGVRKIADLLMLPRSSLPSRFGPELVRRLQQALGEAHESITRNEPEELLQARFGFDGVVRDLRVVQSVVERLLKTVVEQVLRRDEALRRIDCTIYYEDVPPAVLSIELSRASRSGGHVYELLARRIESVDLAPGVCGIALAARETSRWNASQGELFESRAAGDDEALGCLIDRVANRLGHAAVVRPQLEDDHQPEMAYRYVPVAEAGSVAWDVDSRSGFVTPASEETKPAPLEETGRATQSGSVSARESVPHSQRGWGTRAERGETDALAPPAVARPVRLLPRAMVIRVIALVPDGPPTWFAYRGREHVVVRAWGPERIETAWWRGPDVRRDYFRVCSESGEQFWIYHAPTDGKWYLHGVFA